MGAARQHGVLPGWQRGRGLQQRGAVLRRLARAGGRWLLAGLLGAACLVVVLNVGLLRRHLEQRQQAEAQAAAAGQAAGPHAALELVSGDGLFLNFVPSSGLPVSAPRDSLQGVRQRMALVPLQLTANMAATNFRTLDWIVMQVLPGVRDWFVKAPALATRNPLVLAPGSGAGPAAAAAAAAAEAEQPLLHAGAQHAARSGLLGWLLRQQEDEQHGLGNTTGWGAVSGAWLQQAGWTMPDPIWQEGTAVLSQLTSNASMARHSKEQRELFEPLLASVQAQRAAVPLLLQPRAGPPSCPAHRQLQLAAAGLWGSSIGQHLLLGSRGGHGSSSGRAKAPAGHATRNPVHLQPGLVALLGGLVRPGEVVADVGAGEGSAALLLSSKVGPSGLVVVYEPQRLLLQLLAANAAVNGIMNLALRHACPAHTPGYADARLAPHNGGLIDRSLPADASTDAGGAGSDGNGDGGNATRGAAVGSPSGHNTPDGYCRGAHHATVCVRVAKLDDDLKDATSLGLLKVTLAGTEQLALFGAQAVIKRLKPVVAFRPPGWHGDTALLGAASERGVSSQEAAGPVSAARPADSARSGAATAPAPTSSSVSISDALIKAAAHALGKQEQLQEQGQQAPPPAAQQQHQPLQEAASGASLGSAALLASLLGQDMFSQLLKQQDGAGLSQLISSLASGADGSDGGQARANRSSSQPSAGQADASAQQGASQLLSHLLSQVAPHSQRQQPLEQREAHVHGSQATEQHIREVQQRLEHERHRPAAAAVAAAARRRAERAARHGAGAAAEQQPAQLQPARRLQTGGAAAGASDDGTDDGAARRRLLDSGVVIEIGGSGWERANKSGEEQVQEMMAARQTVSGDRPDYVMVTGHSRSARGAAGVGVVATPSVDPEAEAFDLAAMAARVRLPPAMAAFDAAAFLQGLGYTRLAHPHAADLVIMLPPGFEPARAQAALGAAADLAVDHAGAGGSGSGWCRMLHC